ncbi:MAG: hypothetical protein ABIJ21_05705 [Nanoarchaeota archaeon]
MRGKKGDSTAGAKLPYYIVFALFMLPLIFLIVVAARVYIGGILFLDENVYHEMYAERAMTCFAVYDQKLERTLLVIDKAKISDERLDECFAGSHKGISVSLEDERTHIPLVTARNANRNTPDTTLPFPVLYVDAGMIKRGVLKVAISKKGGS